MKITVAAPSDLTAEHLSRWREIQDSRPELASPYFSPEFAANVAEVRNDVAVGILEDDTGIKGFFPHQHERSGVGRPVGGALADFQGLIIDEDCEFSPLELIRGCGLRVWQFDHLLASQRQLRPFHESVDESPVMDLSNGFEEYASERRRAGSEQIKKLGTLRRKLEREVGPLRQDIHSSDTAIFSQLLEWKSRQYSSSNLIDIFSFRWITDLLERIRSYDSPDFGGLLSVLYAGDKRIAVHLGMRSKTVLHYWFPAYDQEFSKFSPGLLLLIEVATASGELGVRRIDLGKGSEQYKQRLKSYSVDLAVGRVEIPSLTGAVERMGGAVENWVRASPLTSLARIPGRWIKEAQRKRRFR
jgi:CelD/BcsL family acetyltransferase involved in cellulose biosynthesis